MREQSGPASGMCVAGRNHRYRQGPRYRQLRVVVHDTQVLGGVVRTVDAVADVCGCREGLKAVQKSRWYIKVLKGIVVEQKYLFGTERRRPGPDVDQHVVDCTVGASHQLRFSPARSAVHSAYHTTGRAGLGVLHEGGRNTWPAEGSIEQFRVEGASEQAPVIPERLRGEDEDIRELGCFDAHRVMLP